MEFFITEEDFLDGYKEKLEKVGYFWGWFSI
jgi:hypothetical protein